MNKTEQSFREMDKVAIDVAVSSKIEEVDQQISEVNTPNALKNYVCDKLKTKLTDKLQNMAEEEYNQINWDDLNVEDL